MFGGYVRFPVVVAFDYDPTADDDIPIWRAPVACEVKSAYAIVANDVAADGTVFFDLALYNGGAAGTALTALGGTIGGTAGWVGLTPYEFTIAGGGTVAAGDLIKLRYNEELAGTFTMMTVQLDVVYGT